MDSATLTAFLIGVVVGPVLIVAGFAAFVWLKVRRQMKDLGAAATALAPPALPVTAPIPLTFAVETLDGQPIDVAGSVAGRPVFLNFWARWCGPCQLEWPSIERLRAELGPDVAFVLASTEDAATIRAFLAQHGYTAPVVRLTGPLPPELESDGVPATFVLDRDGRPVLSHVGAADWSHPSVVAFLRGLVGPVTITTDGDCADGVCAVPAAS